jgi:hypothetical protein
MILIIITIATVINVLDIGSDFSKKIMSRINMHIAYFDFKSFSIANFGYLEFIPSTMQEKVPSSQEKFNL